MPRITPSRPDRPSAPGLVGVGLALAVLLPGGAAAAAPRAIDAFEGRAELLVLDQPGQARATQRWTLRQGTERVTLDVPAGTRLVSGSRIRVTGRMAGGELRVQRVARTRAARRLAADATAADPAHMRVAVIMATLPGDRSRPWTAATVRDTYLTGDGSAARFYDEVSNGRLAVDGEVYGWYDLDLSATGCALDPWMRAAEEAATADGYDATAFTHVSLVIPAAACRFAGAAVVGGRESWIRSLGTDGSVVLHELGHNLGSQHASAQDCSGGSCTVSTYGDPHSVMGRATHGHPTAYQRAQMGLLRDAEILQLALEPGRHVVRVTPASATGGNRLVRLERPDGHFLDLELRRPFGHFEDLQGVERAARSVLVHEDTGLVGGGDSILVDTTPETPGEPDQGVPEGGAWVDQRAGIGILVRSIDDAGAELEITVVDARRTDGPDRVAPTAPMALEATPVAGATGIRLTWAAAVDAGGGLRYTVRRDGREVATLDGRTWQRAGLVAGERATWSVVATDAAGNTGPARAVEATVVDRLAPAAPRGVKVSFPTRTSVAVRWRAVQDASGIKGYRVVLDGRALKLGAATQRTLRRLTPGWHDLAVRAVDGAGNQGRLATVSFRIRG